VTSRTTQTTTHTLDVPGATLTYDVRRNDASTEPILLLVTIGDKYQASGVFDGWGYLNLHDATKPNLPIIGTYAVPESLDPAFASGFGILSIHEIKTDPREENLGYISYYNAGFRVVRFNKKGISEVGRFIDQGGNDFWGVFPIGDETVGHGYSGPIRGKNPFVLASDRDFGLYIFRYTG